MFIGICGSICAGKRTIANYLADHHGFTHLYLTPKHTTQTTPPSSISSSTTTQTTFSTPEELLEFVTKRWRDRFVTTDIPSEEILEMYTRRPFFLLLSVDAPLTVRWKRFLARQSQSNHGRFLKGPNEESEPDHEVTDLESFVTLNDSHLYDPVNGTQAMISRATVRLLNTSSSLAHLYATLGKLDLLNQDRLRPSWDAYFMALAELAAQRANCMKRRVGCVIVRDKRVISTGYNGTPRGLVNCGEGGCDRCNAGQGSGHGLTTCLCIHAEENALLEAGRERVREGAVLYCTTHPCLTCSIKIVQVGIGEVVYSHGYSMDGDTAAVFREAGVKLRQYAPPANGLVHLEKLDVYK
ncbi:Deoxycytidine monophosphate (dCMP) deaminase [Podospora pseudopauciseta]|uniref:dCMP deaminase n=2 Tax=Podospora TaxID=5144 RepID=A0ABR0HMY4_9PEZI|nr:Deoxycytidine monophosphate (dCMP) deaminase [Podospora pseudopauciseta]KAK4679170.1 Deoxycytidine monophosphate (dCMP) deaminase [Podospora pseudoanserina]